MAFSVNTPVGDGVTKQFAVNFTNGIFSRDSVKVFVDGELDGSGNQIERDFIWINDGLIELTGDAPASGVTINIRRIMDKQAPAVDFEDGEILNEANLDLTNDQLLNLIHELLDGYGFSSLQTDINMNGNSIFNLAPALEATSAVNREQVIDIITELGTGFAASREESQVANEGQTLFQLQDITYSPGLNNIAVYINGVRQNKQDYVEASTTSVVFTGGVRAGDLVTFISNEKQSEINLNEVDEYIDQQVDNLIEYKSEQQTASQDQTLFSLTEISYTPASNKLGVFINGVKQYPATFTESSATEVVFTTPLSQGDEVLFVTNEYSDSATITAKDWATVSEQNAQAAILNAQSASVSDSSAIQSALQASQSASAAEGFSEASEQSAVSSGQSATQSANSAALSLQYSQAADQSGVEAADSATDAGEFRDTAQRWANEEYGVEILTGQFSAKHWAEEAQNAVSGGVINDGTTSSSLTWSSQKISTELSSKAESSHTHSTSDITSGTFPDTRIPGSSQTVRGGVRVWKNGTTGFIETTTS